MRIGNRNDDITTNHVWVFAARERAFKPKCSRRLTNSRQAIGVSLGNAHLQRCGYHGISELWNRQPS
jgi:hypothetical protein